MKTKMFAFVLLAVLLALAAIPVYADSAPTLPHAFYGKVDVNGSPAPVGTQVGARGEGVQSGVAQNPIVITDEGEYGSGTDPLVPKLIVWGDIAEGTIVTFYVNGFATGQTAGWHSGEVTEVDLAVTIEEGAVPEEPEETTGSTPPDTGDSTPPDTTDSAPPATTGSTPPATGDSTSPESTEPASGEASSGPLLPPPPPSSGPGSWPVLWWVIGGVVLVGLIIAFVVARSRAY
jgi:hypothetical protein